MRFVTLVRKCNARVLHHLQLTNVLACFNQFNVEHETPITRLLWYVIFKYIYINLFLFHHVTVELISYHFTFSSVLASNIRYILIFNI